LRHEFTQDDFVRGGGVMLIRWATEDDLPQWYALATEVSPIFQHPADMAKDPEFITFVTSKSAKHEALTAVDYRSGAAMGFIGFSRIKNQISWFAVSEAYRGKGAGDRLLKTALRQLDHAKPITVVTFDEGFAPGIAARNLYRKYGFVEAEHITGPFDMPRSKLTLDLSGERRGCSFHYHYPAFAKQSRQEFCPACNGAPPPAGQTDILLEHTAAVAEYPGQGRLFGKMYVMPKRHYFHFEDMHEDEMIGFMREVQMVGNALRKVTGAVKINYEMHANSAPHLHIHLFPRYLDDDFPSAPIDYRVTEPAPYEDEQEFLWFVEQMRKELLGD
jgi:diadenosine tetraphosphate (Ap4A) HIT family hydrolase/ribosomal protein S18 acetylase RimI-like enzyme